MGEIRSPYFSLGQNYFGDNSDHIHSPYISYGGEDYHGDYAEIHPPYSSAGDYRGDNAEIHSPYSSAGDYLADNTEIHSEALFHQHISGNSYNAQQFVKHGKVTRRVIGPWNYEQESVVCIYRVGKALRKSNEAMYSPQQISIGPIHHGNENLRLMERKKSKYYGEFWKGRVSKEKELEGAKSEFRAALREDENTIRQCYEDDSHEIEKSEDFLDLILYDAVFIFELFLKYREGREKYIKDSILKEPWLRLAIRRDLILFENQLPFFILEKLHELLPKNIKGEHTDFKALACSYFKPHLRSNLSPAETMPKHFTDLVRSLLSFTQNGKSVELIKSFHSATKLRQAGVKFKVPRERNCLLDVDFRRLGTEFHIPQLEIDGNTERLFRNLMAMEKRLYPGQEYVCHYINLLSILVVKPKDAKLLMENKIVTYCKDEVAVRDLICSLASSSTTDLHSCYHDIFSAVDDYYKSSGAKNPAYFIEEFFGNFWKGVGTVSAAILLILTLVQTICAILGLR
ncbi:UPF0481 protein At3g47200 isoform X3 [Populus trichocarpa]|uniref:UPF0481 protein At3g47200 isoform X3 n=1 Tax=Populus trichocarpa TaxID=3694 RepID=UPI002277E974|nr:UPF0481 protein At3g47200 isoform X3 [Populus trichocarpa]